MHAGLMLKLPRVCAPRQSDGGTTGMLPDPRSRSAADLLELGHFASGTTAVHKDIPSGAALSLLEDGARQYAIIFWRPWASSTTNTAEAHVPTS